MEENFQKEFEELQNLEKEGLLDETQTARLGELKEKAEAEKTEKQSKDLQSAVAQKEHFRTKTEKLEAEKKELEEKLAKAGQGTSMPTDPLEIVKLGKALGEYNEDEIDFIIRNASDKSPEGIIKASQNEWVQIAIKGMREKVAEKEKIPAPGSASPFASVEKTPQELADMLKGAKTAEERREIHRKYFEQIKKQEKTQGI